MRNNKQQEKLQVILSALIPEDKENLVKQLQQNTSSSPLMQIIKNLSPTAFKELEKLANAEEQTNHLKYLLTNNENHLPDSAKNKKNHFYKLWHPKLENLEQAIHEGMRTTLKNNFRPLLDKLYETSNNNLSHFQGYLAYLLSDDETQIPKNIDDHRPALKTIEKIKQVLKNPNTLIDKEAKNIPHDFYTLKARSDMREMILQHLIQKMLKNKGNSETIHIVLTLKFQPLIEKLHELALKQQENSGNAIKASNIELSTYLGLFLRNGAFINNAAKNNPEMKHVINLIHQQLMYPHRAFTKDYIKQRERGIYPAQIDVKMRQMIIEHIERNFGHLSADDTTAISIAKETLASQTQFATSLSNHRMKASSGLLFAGIVATAAVTSGILLIETPILAIPFVIGTVLLAGFGAVWAGYHAIQAFKIRKQMLDLHDTDTSDDKENSAIMTDTKISTLSSEPTVSNTAKMISTQKTLINSETKNLDVTARPNPVKKLTNYMRSRY